MTEEERAAMPAYIGRAPCGCIRMATIDEPHRAKENAKEIAAVLRLGWTVERVTAGYVREHWGPGCEQCNPPPKKRAKKASPAAQEALPL